MGQQGAWTIGPLALWVARVEGEWRIAFTASEDAMNPTVRVVLPCQGPDLMTLDKVTRFAVSGSDETLWLRPALADRPIIGRPEKPFVVLPDDEVTVYISTPLWVRVEVGDPPRQLLEVPAYRPSDTWFGPDTTEGELCYAGRAAMRLSLDEVELRDHRAVTAVHIRNRGAEVLTVERLNLPVVYLSLHRDPDGELWTEDVVFERPAGQQVFQLLLRESARRRRASSDEELTPPRLPMPDRLSVRALASLFA
jgi:hypothetical protein